MNNSLENAGIETIQYLEFSLRIIDSEDWSNSFNTDRIRIETNADPNFSQAVDDSGTLIVERDGVRIIMKKLETVESFWGAELIVFIENNSGQDISITAKDVSINGFMVDPIFFADVLSGARAFEELAFMESDLKDNDITDITEIELCFHVFNKDGWETIFDTEIINITFE